MNAASQPDKELIHRSCLNIVQKRITELGRQLADLTESAANETKSTAGDKYETARAMLQIEQDQVRHRITDSQQQLSALQAIDPVRTASRIGPGSLVRLGGSWYYLSTSLGRQAIGGVTLFIVSMQSPIGAKLKGLVVGDRLSMNGSSMTVEEML